MVLRAMSMTHSNRQARMIRSIVIMISILQRLLDILTEIFMVLGAQEAPATVPSCHQSRRQPPPELLIPTLAILSASSPFMSKSMCLRTPMLQAIDLVDTLL